MPSPVTKPKTEYNKNGLTHSHLLHFFTNRSSEFPKAPTKPSSKLSLSLCATALLARPVSSLRARPFSTAPPMSPKLPQATQLSTRLRLSPPKTRLSVDPWPWHLNLTKVTVNLELPHGTEFSEVDMQLRVLPGHVATLTPLKPGILSLHEGNDVTKYFVCSRFAFIHASSYVAIDADEAVPIDRINASLVQKGLAEFTQKLNSASTDLEKAEAQIGIDVHSALNAALTV